MKWFETVFIPSICKRMNNPKYPRSAILSEKQADICCQYMTPRQCYSDYGWFTIYEITIDGVSYYLRTRGKYTFLSRSATKEELAAYESERAAREAERELEKYNRLVRCVNEDPERFQRRYQEAKEQLERAQKAYAIITSDPDAKNYAIDDAKEDLEEAKEKVEKFVKAIEEAKYNI